MSKPNQDPANGEKAQNTHQEKSSAVVKTVQDLVSSYEHCESFTYQKDLIGATLEIRIKMSGYI